MKKDNIKEETLGQRIRAAWKRLGMSFAPFLILPIGYAAYIMRASNEG